jgi:hypothetical protein
VRERVYRVRRTTESIPLEPKSIVEINKEYEDREQQTVTPTAQLWNSTIREYWESALSRYWNYVKPQNLNLEKELNNMNVKTITDIDDWYSFLLNKYFAWKYTSPNRYASTTKHFINAYENNRDELYRTIKRLFTFKKENIEDGLMVATTIKGLGTAGASGLLSLLFPNFFGTVDQFVVKALQEVKDLADSDKLQKMNPDSLTIPNGVILISIMREKAADLNSIFQTEYWTPRKIDMILWASRQRSFNLQAKI